MSCTTIIKIWTEERIEHGDELANSWGSAPVIWEAIYKRYGKHYLTKDYFHWMQALESGELWQIYKNVTVPAHHRAVFMMTFDRTYVLKKDYKTAGEDIRQFLLDFPQNPNNVNHWPSIAELFESDPDIPAIGFWHTSVSENPFDGEWNEEKEEYDPPDWNELYSIYDEIEAIDREWEKKYRIKYCV